VIGTVSWSSCVVLVDPSSILVLVVESTVVLVEEVSTRLMLVLELSSMLVLVDALSSRLVLVTSLETDTDELASDDAEPAIELELASRESSPDAHATPTRSRAAATAVNTPIIFLYIDRPPW
jgi:hypothetical protein